MHGRLLIVSNRLPVTIREEQGQVRLVPSSGGLATALRGPHEQSKGLWFGWPGELSDASPGERDEIAAALRAIRAVPVPISAREIAHYYDGFANGVLWPLFHYLIDKVRLDADHQFQVYQQINRRFAEAVAREYKPGDVIWVHDYQLALVPGYLRSLLPDAEIGFFLHVPFPSADVFRILPWREEVLRGLLGADVIGFHTAGYRHNFAHSAALLLHLDIGVDTLTFEDRTIRVGVYPISVDAAAFESAAELPEVLAEVARLRAETAGSRIVLGIDRLDYTKGIPRRLLAIDRLLRSEPAMRDRVHFIQLAVPTREKVDAYAELRRTVNELVGRVNSHHGTASRAPIQLLYRSVPFNQLVALYRAADVMLVTPLRDGMNLVAKEYVSCRTDDRGVLVLSELAGAADELHEALLVNPYDLSGVAAAIVRALEMDAGEQQMRMSAMRVRARKDDVHAWVAGFLDDLEPRQSERSVGASAPPAGLSSRMEAARDAPSRLLLLDYDGTLVPLALLPDLAVPDAGLLELLRALAALPHTDVHIVTGRTRASIEKWLGRVPVGLHAEHGFWTRRDGQWVANAAAPDQWSVPIRRILVDFVERTPGALIEEKSAALAFHFRASDPTLAGERVRELRVVLSEAIQGRGLEVLEGSKVLEVRLQGVNKGLLVRKLLADASRDTAIIAAGDDRTDEDLFEVLPPGAISIRVGPGRTRATHHVESTAALRAVLARLFEPSAAAEPAPGDDGMAP